MSVARIVMLECDGCATTYSSLHDTATEAREDAEDNGWTVYFKGHRKLDNCATCSNKRSLGR